MAPKSPHSAEHPEPAPDLRRQASELGTALAQDFRDLLGSLPDVSWRARALASRLEQTVATTSRLLRGVGHTDPLGVLLRMPGPQPLRRIVAAVKREGGSAKFVRRTSKSIDRFEGLIQKQNGGRAALESILAAWIPEARSEFEMRRRQGVFRANRELRGVHQDVELLCHVLGPSARPGQIDLSVIQAALGLRRDRPGICIEVSSVNREMPAGEGIVDLRSASPGGPFGPGGLDHYCTLPPAKLKAHKLGAAQVYTLDSEEFGRESAVDFLQAHHHPGSIARDPGDQGDPFFFHIATTPIHKLVVDCFVHRELLAEREPQLFVHSVTGKGPATPGQLDRALDLIETHEALCVHADGMDHAQIAEFPNYVPLLTEIIEHLGQDSAAYRLVRVCMEYPVLGTQVSVVLPLE